MTLLSIDPGKKAIGWAMFTENPLQKGGDLWACGLVRGDDLKDLIKAIASCLVGARRAIIEIPQVYQQRHWGGDPNDLIDVALVAGAVAGRLLCPVEFVKPHAWKGTRKKRICHALTRKTLTDDEWSIVESVDAPSSLRHNVIDAVGIGLWRLKRR